MFRLVNVTSRMATDCKQYRGAGRCFAARVPLNISRESCAVNVNGFATGVGLLAYRVSASGTKAMAKSSA